MNIIKFLFIGQEVFIAYYQPIMPSYVFSREGYGVIKSCELSETHFLSVQFAKLYMRPFIFCFSFCVGGSEGQGRIHQRFPEKDWEDNPFPQGLELVSPSQTNSQHMISQNSHILPTVLNDSGRVFIGSDDCMVLSLSVLSAQWMAAGSREKASLFLCVSSHGHQLRAALLCVLHLLGVRGEPAGLCRARADEQKECEREGKTSGIM